MKVYMSYLFMLRLIVERPKTLGECAEFDRSAIVAHLSIDFEVLYPYTFVWEVWLVMRASPAKII